MLGNKAEIFRCMLSRKAENGINCREIVSFDAISGLVDLKNTRPAKISLTECSKKYLLQRNDILLVHVGSMDRIGETGLVGDVTEPIIAGRSLWLIRAKGVDPIWLFYWLKQMRKSFPLTPPSQDARPLSSAFINLETFKTLHLPAARNIDDIHSIHAEIIASTETISQETAHIIQNCQRINDIFNV